MFLDLWYFWFTSKVLKCMYVRSPELCTPIIHMFDVLLYTYLLMWLSCYIYPLFCESLRFTYHGFKLHQHNSIDLFCPRGLWRM